MMIWIGGAANIHYTACKSGSNVACEATIIFVFEVVSLFYALPSTFEPEKNINRQNSADVYSVTTTTTTTTATATATATNTTVLFWQLQQVNMKKGH